MPEKKLTDKETATMKKWADKTASKLSKTASKNTKNGKVKGSDGF